MECEAGPGPGPEEPAPVKDEFGPKGGTGESLEAEEPVVKGGETVLGSQLGTGASLCRGNGRRRIL